MERLAELAQYDQAFNGALVDDDFLAAGFTPDEVSSYRSQTAPQSMTQADISALADQYGNPQEPDYTLRERMTQGSQDFFSDPISYLSGESPDPNATFGMEPYNAGVLSRSILGDPNSSGSSYGMGLADFTPLGAVFGAEEGSRTASRGYEAGDPVQMGLGALEAGLGMAEAFPLTKAVAAPAARAVRRWTKGGPQSVGEAASQAYMVGEKLKSFTDYEGVKGKGSSVNIPDTGRVDARPISEIENAAKSYMSSRGMDASVFDAYPAFSEERARLIAAAYDMMPNDPKNPAVRDAYDAMIEETLAQYKTLKDSGISFNFLKEGQADPYSKSPALGYQDLVENGRLVVFPTDFGFGTDRAFDAAENPLLKRVGRIGDKEDAVANDAFRAVHDIFGHFGSGNPFFRRQGEERAFLEHSRMYSPEAKGAMTSETRGQNSWLNSGPFGESNRTALVNDTVFADQKTGLMPSWTYEPSGMPSDEEAKVLMDYIESKKWK